MPRKRHKPEEIVAKLRQVDVLVSQGHWVADAVRSIGVTEVTYYRWRQEFGGLKSDQVRRLKDLEAENGRLSKYVEKHSQTTGATTKPALENERDRKANEALCQIISILEEWGRDMLERTDDGALWDMVSDKELISKKLMVHYNRLISRSNTGG